MNWLDRIYNWLADKPRRGDLAAVLALTFLWAFYFWRVLTPNTADQVSLPEGDFSGQFLAFGDYQAQRILAGEIPLWNPYNYAGHPFIADTQAAIFYPVRLISIALSPFVGGWSYALLQAEVIAHYWLGSLWMYLFVRTSTHSHLAGLISAVTITYGGYLTGYPPLQLAILEAGIWLPLVLLSIYKASETGHWQAGWLALGALALGSSLLAGHPQTSLFISYILIAYIIHRAAKQRIGWSSTLLAIAGLIGLGFGLAAVQILPGLEYTRLTVRAKMDFNALAGGFPFSDLIVFLLPNVTTFWSPLYSGVIALMLAGLALWRRVESAWFWGGVALIALFASFGGATPLYHLAHLTLPGFAMFRGQERAAYLIAHSIAILAGLGVSALQSKQPIPHRLGRTLATAASLAWVFIIEIFIAKQVYPKADLSPLLRTACFLAILATLAWILLGRLAAQARTTSWSLALIGLVVLDLFSATMNTNWEPTPVSKRDLLSDLVPVALADKSLFRVDGRLGLGENYGTLIGLQDIRGTSPLRLATLDNYLNLPQYRLHQILAVKYVFTDWQQLEIPSEVLAITQDSSLPLYLHKIDNPLPRAWMTYRAMNTLDETQALGWLADPSFNPLQTVILNTELPFTLPAEPPSNYIVSIERYAPESITLSIDTPANGVLVLSEIDYPGWQATVNGDPAKIWRANAGLRALPLRTGHYQVIFTYRPISVKLGIITSGLSAATLSALGILALRRHSGKRGDRG